MTPDPWYGRELGGYRVGDELGTALGGELYAAHQIARGRPVVLKIVDPTVAAAAGFRARFERDVALLGSFFHPHVVTLYGAGTVEGTSFLAMRPDDDPTLEELIAQVGALDTPRATAIVAQIATALDAVHQRGLVHRGLSPASILVRTADAGEQAAITDFAVADDTAGYGGLFTPPLGTAPPPVDYAAPEQVRGDPTTPASDVYALGAILFEALTGLAPFSDLPRGATLEAHLHEPVPRATALIFDLAPSFDDLFARALAKDPADRFASAGELVAAIPAAERVARRRGAATVVARRRGAPGGEPTAPHGEPASAQAGAAAPHGEPASAQAGAAAPRGEPASAQAGAAPPHGEPASAQAEPAASRGEPASARAEPAAPRETSASEQAEPAAPPAAIASASAGSPPAPAADPAPAFHFLHEDGYDARAGSANYGPEESGVDAPGGEGPDPASTAAFDAALADAVDIDDDLGEEDPEPEPEPEPGPGAPADPELDALVATAAASDEPAPAHRARRGLRAARKRRPPDIEPIAGIVSAPRRRRRRRRRPGVALIVAGLLLLTAGVCVLLASGLFDDDGDKPTTTTTAAADKRSEADALADLRGSGTPPPAAEPTTTTATPSGDRTPPPASADDGASAAVSGWPAGHRGYTAVVFTSPTDRATARDRARRASELGLASGVLRSDDFKNLEPGVWVTFAGISETQAGAERVLSEIREGGLASAPYVRLIDPR